MAQQRRRKALNFDLSSERLREYFGEKGRRKAYAKIKAYLIKNGFEHRQWSGYASIKPMDYIEIYDIVGGLVDECKWLVECANRFDATNIMAESDMIDAIRNHERDEHADFDIPSEFGETNDREVKDSPALV